MSAGERLPAGLEVAGLVRAVLGAGDHAAVLHKGDPDRGALLLVITTRGRVHGLYERILGLNGVYDWHPAAVGDEPDSLKVAEFLAKRARFDPDCWAVELDIADPQRFIAENLGKG